MTFTDGFILLSGCVLSSLLLLTGHWFPWARVLGREMHRLEAYTYGTGSIFSGFLLVCYLYGDLSPVWWLAAIIISSGLSVYGAWYFDHKSLEWTVTRRRARKNEHLAEE